MSIIEKNNRLTFGDIELSTTLSNVDARAIDSFINENFSNYEFKISQNDFSIVIKIAEMSCNDKATITIETTIKGFEIVLQINDMWSTEETTTTYPEFDNILQSLLDDIEDKKIMYDDKCLHKEYNFS